MLEQAKMLRLNELAKKKKTGTISPAELTEQSELRQEYLAVFRGGMREMIENTKIIDPEGNDVTPEKVKAIKAGKKIH